MGLGRVGRGEEEFVYNLLAGGDCGLAGVEVAMFVLLAGVHVVEVVADDYRVIQFGFSILDCFGVGFDVRPGEYERNELSPVGTDSSLRSE